MSEPFDNEELPVVAPVGAPPESGVSQWTLWKFYAPLAASNAMMTLSHAIINGSLNRTSQPAQSVASYAVANSICVLAESPMVMLRQTGAALVRDRAGWGTYMRVALLAGFIDQLLCLAIAWTPLAYIVIHRWMGARDELFPAAVSVFQVLMFVSLFSALRSIFHSVLLVKQKTLWITLGMALRVVMMLALAALFSQTGWLDSGMRGGVIFLAGMAVEAISAFGSFRKWFHSLPQQQPRAEVSAPPLTFRRVATFYLPLVVAAITGAMTMSIINAGLSRIPDPQSVIATAAIGSVVTYLLMGPLFMIHQVSLFFSAPLTGAHPHDRRDRTVGWFCVQTGVGATVIVGLLAWTPLGDWLLLHAFQAPATLLALIKDVLRVSMFLPLIAVWNEYRNGKLLAAGHSRMLTAAKLLNVAMLVLAVTTLVSTTPSLGARISPIASLCALAAEQIVLLIVCARLKKA
ncbi:MAG: hypothetical protein WCV00_01145 [Verrucomicrobiia bacterium]